MESVDAAAVSLDLDDDDAPSSTGRHCGGFLLAEDAAVVSVAAASAVDAATRPFLEALRRGFLAIVETKDESEIGWCQRLKRLAYRQSSDPKIPLIGESCLA